MSRWRYAGALIVITLGGAALRVATLDLQSYWNDEVFTARLTSMSFGQMLDELRVTESTPPLYYVIAWAWAKVFGVGEIGLRSLSAVAGTLFIPVAYAGAATLVSRRVGLLTAALAATSPILVWYSQEARSYMLMILACGLSFLFFSRTLREQTWVNLAGWAASSAAALAIHYFAGFVVAAEAVVLLALGNPRWRALVASAPIALLGLALLPLMRQQSLNPEWIDANPLGLRFGEVVRQLVTPAPLPPWAGAGDAALASHWLWWLALAVLGAALFSVKRLCPPAWQRGTLVALYLGSAAVLLPLVLGVGFELIANRGDFLLDRNVLSAWLPLAIVVATGFGAPRASPFGTAAVAALCAAGCAVTVAIASNERLQRDDWRTIAPAIPRDAPVVLTLPAYQVYPLSYYDQHLVNADNAGSRVAHVVVVRRSGFDLGSLSLPAGFQPTRRQRIGRWEIISLRSRPPELVPAQPGRLVRSGSD